MVEKINDLEGYISYMDRIVYHANFGSPVLNYPTLTADEIEEISKNVPIGKYFLAPNQNFPILYKKINPYQHTEVSFENGVKKEINKTFSYEQKNGDINDNYIKDIINNTKTIVRPKKNFLGGVVKDPIGFIDAAKLTNDQINQIISGKASVIDFVKNPVEIQNDVMRSKNTF